MQPISRVILGSFFSDSVVFYGDIIFMLSTAIMHQIVLTFLARVLILVSKTSATAMMYRPIELTDVLFQLSTFGGAGNVYSKLQGTKTAL